MAVTINGTTGITTTGDYDAEDNDKILLGTRDDLQIFHDGNNNHIQGTTAGQSIYLKNDYEIQFLTSTNEKQLVSKADGAVELYHNNSKKLETYADGVLFDGHGRPGTNNSHDLGTASHRWRNIYTNDLNLSNEGSSNDVDGTWGDWTIQEGESDLFLKNNRSGKKYKFNLTEVS